MEGCSGRFRKGFYLGDARKHVEVCPRRCRKGFIWTIRGSMWRFASDDFDKGLSRRPGVACGGLLRTISSRFYLDAPERHVEVCSGRVRKGFAWTIRGSMWRFAPNEFVKVVSNRSGEHVEVCSGRCCKGFIWTILGACGGLLVRAREGFIWTMQGNVWRFAPDEFVNGLSGRSEVACGG